MTARRTVVVGASVAGVRTAQGLRAAGHSGRIVLVGAESAMPYDKPPLSKAYLAGHAQVALLDDRTLSGLDLDLRLGEAAIRLDPATATVHLADGEALDYDDLVIATGARPRPSPWGLPPRAHLLRTIDDATRLRDELAAARTLAVVGAGVIGAEVATVARDLGVDVTLVDSAPGPLMRLLPPDVSVWMAERYAARGIHLVLGTSVSSLTGDGSGCAIAMADGSGLEADVVLVAIGSVPNVEWLASSGLDLDNGVRCDHYGRAVGAAAVYAVGDAARWWVPGQGRPERWEHWTGTVDQAACVAHNVVHPDQLRAIETVQYMWSDQVGGKLQVLGRAGDNSRAAVFTVDPSGDRWFAVFGPEDGVATGVGLFGWPRGIGIARRGLEAATSTAELGDSLSATF